MSKNVLYEPTIEIVFKEPEPKHLRKKKSDPFRKVQVTCKNGHSKIIKAALFFDKAKKGNKKLHFCQCGERFYLEE